MRIGRIAIAIKEQCLSKHRIVGGEPADDQAAYR